MFPSSSVLLNFQSLSYLHYIKLVENSLTFALRKADVYYTIAKIVFHVLLRFAIFVVVRFCHFDLRFFVGSAIFLSAIFDVERGRRSNY